jgi:hypothetical protein
MNSIDKSTLKAVGETVFKMVMDLYSYKGTAGFYSLLSKPIKRRLQF